MRPWELSLLQDGGMVPGVHIQVLTLPTDQFWESTLSHTNTLNINPSSSQPARKFYRDTSGYGCPVHDLWGMMEGVGLCGDPSFSVQQSLGHPLGSSPCRLSEPRTLRTEDLSPPAPKRSPHLSESLVGNQGTSLCISPWQGERHSMSLPPWWARPSHQHWWSSSSQWWWPRCHPPRNWGSIHSLAETRQKWRGFSSL